MRNICLSYLDPKSRNTLSENGRNAARLRSQNEKSLMRNRTTLLATTKPPSTSLVRSYFRAMRAAEMAAWEMTGGDYLQSCFVTQA
jgi:hypothetical protein